MKYILTGLISLAFSLVAIAMTMERHQPHPPQIITQYVDGTFGWRTPQANGAAPADVLRATIARMQYEQGTPLGSDRNAQALVKAMEALQILEGREVETKDGFPVIE